MKMSVAPQSTTAHHEHVGLPALDQQAHDPEADTHAQAPQGGQPPERRIRPAQRLVDVADPDGEQHPAPEHRDDQPVRHRPQPRVVHHVADPLRDVPEELDLSAAGCLPDLEAGDHHRGEDERERVEQEREGGGVVRERAVERDEGGDVLCCHPEAAEQGRRHRDRPVRRTEDEPVGLFESPLGDQEGDARVPGGEEEQRDRLVDEGDRVQHPELREEGDQRDEDGPGDVAGDHDRSPVPAVGHHAAHRSGEDRWDQPEDQHDRDGRLVLVRELIGGGDERERRHPVAQRGH